MKKIGDLMKDMGFNPKSSASVQEAFIKHLIKASEGTDVITPSEKKTIQDNPHKILNLKKENQFHQMSFNFDTENIEQKKTGS